MDGAEGGSANMVDAGGEERVFDCMETVAIRAHVEEHGTALVYCSHTRTTTRWGGLTMPFPTTSESKNRIESDVVDNEPFERLSLDVTFLGTTVLGPTGEIVARTDAAGTPYAPIDRPGLEGYVPIDLAYHDLHLRSTAPLRHPCPICGKQAEE